MRALPALAITLLAFLPRAEPAPAAPAITSLTPSTAIATTLTLTIGGSGFDSASVPDVSDAKGLLAPVRVTTHSATRIVATVSLAGAGPGTYTVRVRNPPGRPSKAVPLTLGAEVSVSPRSGPPGTTFAYSGQGFTAGFGAISRLRRPDGREFPAKRMPVGADGTFQDVIWSGEFVPGTYTVWAADDYAKIASPPVTFVVVP